MRDSPSPAGWVCNYLADVGREGGWRMVMGRTYNYIRDSQRQIFCVDRNNVEAYATRALRIFPLDDTIFASAAAVAVVPTREVWSG